MSYSDRPQIEVIELFVGLSQLIGTHPSGYGLVVRERGEVTYTEHGPLCLHSNNQKSIWEATKKALFFLAELAKTRKIDRAVVHLDDAGVVNRMARQKRKNTKLHGSQYRIALNVIHALDFPVRFSLVTKKLNHLAKAEARLGREQAQEAFAVLSAEGLNPARLL
jgi:ribonuclease HI